MTELHRRSHRWPYRHHSQSRRSSLYSPAVLPPLSSPLSHSLHSLTGCKENAEWAVNVREDKKDMNVEMRPVVRRRRFVKRKSINLEPDTSVILARGVSSSSEEEEDKGRLRVVPARRNRRIRDRAHLSMGTLPLSHSILPSSTLNKSQSVADLTHNEPLDFSSHASVSRWTSHILAELESLPSSSTTDLSCPPPIPPHRNHSDSPSESIRASQEFESSLSLSSVDTLKKEEEEGDTQGNHLDRQSIKEDKVKGGQDLLEGQWTIDDRHPLLESISRLSRCVYEDELEDVNGNDSLSQWRRDKEDCRSRLNAPLPPLHSPPSVQSVVSDLFRSLPLNPKQDVSTQTSPPLSRSNSFDWVDPSTHNRSLSQRSERIESSGEEEADREVREVNEGKKKKKKMRHEHSIDDGIALLLHLASEDTSSKESKEERGKKNGLPLIPSTRASSTMSESVYDNVTSPEKSPDCRDHPFRSSRVSIPYDSPQLSIRSIYTSVNSELKAKLERVEDKAAETCHWLRVAGFPQYAQSYQEGNFPLQLDSVLADHRGILDADSVQALSKRIATLNRCAIMKIDGVILRDRSSLDSEQRGYSLSRGEDDGVALSGNWRYQRHSQTWSRMGQIRPLPPSIPLSPSIQSKSLLQRSHSERLKERAKAIIKRMDVRPKPRKEEKGPLVISDPILLSYDTASPRSMMGDTRFTMKSHRSNATTCRSASAGRRQGIVFLAPSSPESSDESSCIRLSRYGEAAPVRSLVQRDRSVPTRCSTSIRRDISSPQDYLYPNRIRVATPTPSTTMKQKSFIQTCTYSTPQFERRKHLNETFHQRFSQQLHADDRDPRTIPTTSPPLAVETSERSDEDPSILDHHRRDSGVGSSLSRSPSAPCSIRIRQSLLPSSLALGTSLSSSINSSSSSWSRKRPSGWAVNNIKENSDMFFSDIQLTHCVDSLSVVNTTKLRKLVFLRLTALLEKYMRTGSRGMVNIDMETHTTSTKNWTVHKLLKKIKNMERGSKEENTVFGQSLCTIRRRNGICLPRTILEVLRYLRLHAAETVGMFRKNGVKSRIGELRTVADRDSDVDVFVDEKTLLPSQVHDVADLLKQYLRELPEPLMTNNLSKTFANIYEHVPEEERLMATRYAVLLLPEENREALQTLLFFFAHIARHSETNNMPADNLSVCLAPSLFQLSASRLNTVTASRRHKTIGGTGMPTEEEMRETRAAQVCLSSMISHSHLLFLADSLPNEVTSSPIEYENDAPLLKNLGGPHGPRSYLINKLRLLIREHDERWRGWIVEGTMDGVEMSTRKSVDGHPLPSFRVWVDIDAPPKEVLFRISKERYVWDTSFINYRMMECIYSDTELYQYVLNDTVGHPTRDCFVVRMQRNDLSEVKGACALVERSVQCSETQLLGGVSTAILDSRYLIEPHQGRSRVTHVSRVDLRGRTANWYCQHYLHLVARQLARLRSSFRHQFDDGPETKV